MCSFFSCDFCARISHSLFCHLLDHDQFCSLCPSVCNSGHNVARRIISPRKANDFNARDGSAMQFSSRTPMAPAGANAESYPCPIHVFCRGCACPLISTYLPSATFNLSITPLLPYFPLYTTRPSARCVLHRPLLPNHLLWKE
jgi:hypothetical protein